jgi:sterol desaturase/sphingolipid hydroxylase (fatty acid hydroxylase superfamily)
VATPRPISTIMPVDAWLRLLTFGLVLVALALAEALWPRRGQDHGRGARWPHNLALIALDTLILRALVPLGVVGIALWGEAAGVGLFRLVAAPWWVSVPVTILLLDLAVYLQHVLFHRVPWLWRLHRVHHADVDVDVTTGLRFHPVEMLLSLALKGGVVLVVGGGAVAVLAFEILLNASSMFTHANVALPAHCDRLARRVLVTPDMHRVHHSVHRDECNSNYGFNLSCWDRLFGTYRDQPADGHAAMRLGLEAFRAPGDQRLDRLLTQPWRAEREAAEARPGPDRRHAPLPPETSA